MAFADSTGILSGVPLDTLFVTGFVKRYLFHTQNLTHFMNIEAS